MKIKVVTCGFSTKYTNLVQYQNIDSLDISLLKQLNKLMKIEIQNLFCYGLHKCLVNKLKSSNNAFHVIQFM